MEAPRPPPDPSLPSSDPESPVANRSAQSPDSPTPRQDDTAPIARRRVTLEAYEWAAPLPDPSTLRQYAEILPDLPEQIVAQWEKQTDHRIENERKVIDSNLAKEDRGQWMGFAIFLAGMVGAIVLLALGMTPSGLTVFLADLIALVVVFLKGGELGRQQLDEQRERLRDEEQRDLFEDDATSRIESGDEDSS